MGRRTAQVTLRFSFWAFRFGGKIHIQISENPKQKVPKKAVTVWPSEAVYETSTRSIAMPTDLLTATSISESSCLMELSSDSLMS